MRERGSDMFYQFSLELVSMLARNASLPSIVQYVDQMLGNPLMITDETFGVLAYSQNRPVPDPVWKEIIQSQYSSPQLVDQTNVNEFWKRLENSSVPLFVDDDAFRGCVKRVVARIRIGSKTKGYIALLECEKEIDEEDLKALQMLAEILGVKFNEENAISEAVGQLRDRFAKDILTGVIDSEKIIRDRAETMKLKFEKWHMVISVKAIQPQKYISQYLDDICEILKRYAKLCIYTSDGIAAYYIVSFSQKADRKRFIGQDIRSYIEKNGCLYFVSRPVDGVRNLQLCYREVCEMAETLGPEFGEHNIFRYDCLAPIEMIVKASSGEGERVYYCRGLEQLIQTDKNQGTHYVETLRSFFHNNQNVSAAADELYLHRNTVNYRLSKIREILEDDFDDYRIRLHLQMALMWYDVVQMNKK